MARGKRRRSERQASMWIAARDLPTTAACPFYERLNVILDAAGFDAYVESRLTYGLRGNIQEHSARRESAIRMALGATGVNIVQLMTRATLVVVLAGIVIGLAASRAFASVLQPALFNTSATNPLTALLTATVVLVATFVPTVGPIGRVAKLAPAQVLRE